MTDAAAGPLAGHGFANVLAVCEPTADDGPTLALAAALAEAGGGRLTVLSVVEPGGDLDRLAGLAGPDAAERLAAEERERLAAAVADLPGAPSIPVEVRFGKPFLEVVRRVIDEDHDLVVKTAGEPGGLHRFLFSSTDQHLLRKCPCPVWLRVAGARQPARVVLAAIDLADDEASGDPGNGGSEAGAGGLNDRIVETAARIALVEGAHLAVLHAWQAPAEALARRWSAADQAVASYVADVAAARRRALGTLMERTRRRLGAEAVGRLHPTAHLVRGDPRHVLPERARALGADVLVMGTIARTGVPGFIIGNTAEDVINSLDRSVVTVKPPGYVSPVAT